MKNIRNVLVGGSLLISPCAHAYNPSIHYYVTYLSAYWCGLNSDSATIALADYSVDKFASTDPGAHFNEWLDPAKENIRRTFHFPVHKNSKEKVTRASEVAMETVRAAIRLTSPQHPNPVLLGMGLHTLQDSFAHEGFGPRFGHWSPKPDLPDTDPEKLVQSAEATYIALNDWSFNTYGRPCALPFSLLAPQLKSWAEMPIHKSQELFTNWGIVVESITHFFIEPGLTFNKPAFKETFQAAADYVIRLKQ